MSPSRTSPRRFDALHAHICGTYHFSGWWSTVETALPDTSRELPPSDTLLSFPQLQCLHFFCGSSLGALNLALSPRLLSPMRACARASGVSRGERARPRHARRWQSSPRHAPVAEQGPSPLSSRFARFAPLSPPGDLAFFFRDDPPALTQWHAHAAA